MPTFGVRQLEIYKTSVRVFKLIREQHCFYDDFVEEIALDKNLERELYDLDAIIEDAANGKLLPAGRYRKLRLSAKIKYSAYEAKSKHLRLYLIHEYETGKILILGGKKTTQDKDLDRLERLLKEYHEFTQQQKNKSK